MMRIVITGATGYIGQRLIRAALLAGHEVLALSRCPVVQSSVAWQHFDLADTTLLSLPSNIDAVFHLAAETRHSYGAEQIELAAAQRLIDAANVVDASFVFVSSQTARVDAPTGYGRIKWQIECLTLAAGGSVIRPGQVYGGPELGLFGVLCRLVRRLPLLPAFVPVPFVQPVHVDDLADALLACSTLTPSSVLCIASPHGVSFASFLRAIARGRTCRHSIAFPVPTLLIRTVTMLLGTRLNRKLGLDRMASLFALPRMETANDLQRISLTLRPLNAGVSRSGLGRRELLRESRALLTYILRMKPKGALVRRYVRVIETLRTGHAIFLPDLFLYAPALLALVDGADCVDVKFRKEFSWRVDAALMLSEASPQGAIRFLGIDRPASFLRSVLCMAMAILLEACCRAGKLVLRPWLVQLGRQVGE